MNHLEKVLLVWVSDPEIEKNIVRIEEIPPRPALWGNIPESLHPDLKNALHSLGINQLYSHQVQAYELIHQGNHVMLATGTASGKTLAYNLPVLDDCLKHPSSRALYLFPTKALAQDQQTQLAKLLQSHTSLPKQIPVGIYDGDTPASHRNDLRKNARIVLSNPDMLHMGILPHHTLWAEFFRNLRFIIIDEAHIYRGVFGSHFANVIRRLKRVASFYGASPQFILSSATIANPLPFAQSLIEDKIQLISQDGSPAGPRRIFLYNPPVINEHLGIRASAIHEALKLLSPLITHGIQTITFARTRRTVELLLRYLRDRFPGSPQWIEGYRSGYLPTERRTIEAKLRKGEIHCVVATNALELGIDIGTLSASVLVGYPGSIASTRQQIGRAGRKTDLAVSLLVASSDPLDQYLMRFPEYIFEQSPEMALVDPNNLLILVQHIRCAAFELPFYRGEGFGGVSAETVEEILSFLAESGELHAGTTRFIWTADQYPASQISLRTTSPDTVQLQQIIDGKPKVVGVVDRSSALWMVHPGAVYLHAGETYWVQTLDLDRGIAWLEPSELDYYTEPVQETTVEKQQVLYNEPTRGGNKFFGELKVTHQVTGFKKIRWYSRENLGTESLELPPSTLFTTGYWRSLSEVSVNFLRQAGLWRNDPNDYGPEWIKIRESIRKRDHYTCQLCGTPEQGKAHHVHHKVPFRMFSSAQEANRPENLITLCPSCHQRVEENQRIQSGLAGLSYLIHHAAPLFLMCDTEDIGVFSEPQSPLSDGQPTLVVYDQIPGGIGLSKKLYEIEETLFKEAAILVETCPCEHGCPSCVGPAGENGMGGKQETLAILNILNGLIQLEVK
ncbi:DEAD/DEAH box helicase [Anaerolinea thermophila]|uniref:ATP-dependent helicase n=1 Tax=Anaerolinea thermophila (strain DSM 14523 / JCM 11388 / NBRC 100420 / UNI-1) TaxID=926569 RepID=E8N4X1_ANATU|nr:DEAD/DEAH box helicase [Anaerolinea thermophila]BAJ63485.1 putative ATP-dependent helicase [Anaerolinea thermophila UNI-1]